MDLVEPNEEEIGGQKTNVQRPQRHNFIDSLKIPGPSSPQQL
jgi:hypothetical protein